MGLQSFETNKIYVSIADGSIIRTFKEANANTKERITKTGKLVHEQRFKSITGVITDVSTREHDFGKDLIFTIDDEDNVFQLSMPYSSRYSTSIMKALPNVDLNLEVTLMPWSMIDKQDATKKVTGVTLYQSGNKILPAYTKENPNGLPQMVKVKVKGKETWDDTDMMDFLFNATQKQLKAVIGTRPEEFDTELPF